MVAHPHFEVSAERDCAFTDLRPAGTGGRPGRRLEEDILRFEKVFRRWQAVPVDEALGFAQRLGVERRDPPGQLVDKGIQLRTGPNIFGMARNDV